MRWIFIALLICNGVYFLWQNYLQDTGSSISQTATYAKSDYDTKLVLLTERSSADPASTVTSQPDQRSTIGAGDSVMQIVSISEREQQPAICLLIGPFKEQVSGKQVVSRLEALDIAVTLKSIVIAGAPDYWVHLTPQVSRKAAIKMLKELQAKKIDSFLITEGDLADGISLGFFTQIDRANKVYEQRVKQGYDAKIKVVPRTHTEIWAVLAAGEHDKLSDNLWEKVQQGNKGLERRKNFCDKIASQDNFD